MLGGFFLMQYLQSFPWQIPALYLVDCLRNTYITMYQVALLLHLQQGIPNEFQISIKTSLSSLWSEHPPWSKASTFLLPSTTTDSHYNLRVPGRDGEPKCHTACRYGRVSLLLAMLQKRGAPMGLKPSKVRPSLATTVLVSNVCDNSLETKNEPLSVPVPSTSEPPTRTRAGMAGWLTKKMTVSGLR